MEPAYRHNGHAAVYDHLSDISRDSQCDKATTLENESFVHSSELIATSLSRSRVGNSYLVDTAVENSVISDSRVVNSIIRDSFVTDAAVGGSSLADCCIRAFGRLKPSLLKVKLTGVVVDGGAILRGPWVLDGSFYVTEGEWHRPPRSMMLVSESGISVGLTEGWNGKVAIGQRMHDGSQWLRVGPRLGRIAGWTEAEVNMARLFIESVLDEQIAA